MFRAKKKLELTTEAYARWLRAQRPTFEWFLGLGEVEQEALAKLGDDYVQDVAIGLGYAIQNPGVAEAGIKGDPEVAMVQQLAAEAAKRLLSGGGNSKPAAPAQPTMSGLTERSKARADARAEQRDAGRSFFGRRPTPRSAAHCEVPK